MGDKSKARGPTRKGQEKANQKTQAERFIETAREHGADETGEALERAFKKVAPPERRKPPDD